MTKKHPVHVAVLSETDGVLRLVKTDDDGNLLEVGALAVGPKAHTKAGLADVVSASNALAEMSEALGGGVPKHTPPEPVAAPAPKAIGRGTPPPKTKGAKRGKRPTEDRFDRDDICDVLAKAHTETDERGLFPSEIAMAICDKLGEEYHGKDPLARAVGNRLRSMVEQDRIKRRTFDGRYELTESEWERRGGAPVDNSVETVDSEVDVDAASMNGAEALSASA